MQMKIEDDLKDALARASASADPSGDAWERIERGSREPHQPSTGKRIVVALVAAAIGLGGVVVATRAFDRGEASNIKQSPVASHGPIGSVETFDVGWDASESSNALASLQGFAWVSGNQHSSLIDPAGGATPLPFQQGPFGLSSSSTAVWAAGNERDSGNYVARFEPGSAEPDLKVSIENLSLPQVIATDTAIWVTGYEPGSDLMNLGTLIRLDPSSGDVVKRMDLDSI